MTSIPRSARAALLALGLCACQGNWFPDDEPGDRGDPQSCDFAAPVTRLPRLTHTQYANTVRDLTFTDAGRLALADDPDFAGYDNSAENLIVSPTLAQDYEVAAEQVAAAAVDDAAAYAQLVTCQPSDGTCARSFVSSFGRRAFRRPLTEDEVSRYTAFHARGAEFFPERDAFSAGVQLVIEAMLQSPHFLYRVERSSGEDSGMIPLDGWELATRLSYMLWNSMPDEDLLADAETGALDDETVLREQALRMLDDPRARAVLRNFHSQWLKVELYEQTTPRDPALFPDYDADLVPVMQEETLSFLDYVIFDLNGGVREIFTEPSTFVNDRTAELYGISGTFGPEMERVELDPTRRRGLLTQLGFLTWRAYFDRTSPIHRGVFIHRQILCTDLPEPPGNADLNLPPVEGEIVTNRQAVEVHTSPAACRNCHNVINPVGFGFEHYDAVGRWQDTENGEVIDTTGTVYMDGETVTFADGLELIDRFAESEQVRHCFATNVLRYAYGREEIGNDHCTIDTMAQRLADPAYTVRDLLADLTQTESFRSRPVDGGE